MKIPTSLTRKIGGVPAWAWALTLALFLAYVVWKRRQAAAAEEGGDYLPEEEGLSPTADLTGLGGYVGGGTEEGAYALMDAISALGDLMGDNTGTIVDRVGASQSAIEDRIDIRAEQTGALITDGYNPEPGPGMPGAPPPNGSDSGNGNGQLPPKPPTTIITPPSYPFPWPIKIEPKPPTAPVDNRPGTDKITGYNPTGGNTFKELKAELAQRQARGYSGEKFLEKHEKFAERVGEKVGAGKKGK